MNRFAALRALAHDAGLQLAYRDIAGVRQVARVEQLLATLRALGIPIHTTEEAATLLRERWQARLERRCEPVHVWTHGRGTPRLRLLLPAEPGGRFELLVRSENDDVLHLVVSSEELTTVQPVAPLAPSLDFTGMQVELPLHYRLPIGYHEVEIACPDGRITRTLLMVRPATVRPPEDVGLDSVWGVFLPLYAAWREEPHDGATYRRLQELAAWTRKCGGALVGTLPLLPTFLGDDPYDPSPYAPVSRLAWSEFFVDLRALPLPVDVEEYQLTTVPGASGTRLVDYQTSWQQRFAALKVASHQLAQQPALRQEIETWLDTHPILAEYARFRAAVDRFGRPSRWSSSLRAELLKSEVGPGEPAWPYAVTQWLAAQQIATVGHDALYLDLPLGVHPEGFDVWRWPHLFATDASAGAPPDPFFAEGQVWGFPPLHPERVREDGYRYVRAVFTHHLGSARLLRIDHVMGFHRLYWVPAQASGREGVYVRYPAKEYYAVLAIESYRTRCAVAGEDLGTVLRAVRQAMAREGLLRLWVLPFERRNGTFTTPPRLCVASLDTHDLPPFAALWDEWGQDIQRAVVAWLTSAGFLKQHTAPGLNDIIGALLRFLGSSDAAVVLVNLEDLWGERQPQNRPGTGLEQPNWRRLAQYSIADFATTPVVLELLKTLNRAREKSRQRAASASTRPSHDRLGKGV